MKNQIFLLSFFREFPVCLRRAAFFPFITRIFSMLFYE